MVDFVECLGPNEGGGDGHSTLPKCQTGEGFTYPYTNDLEKLPILNTSQITVVGYALGGAVALHAAALDKRISNIASIAGFTPFRNNSNGLPNAGNAYFYDMALFHKKKYGTREKRQKMSYAV